MGCEPNGVGRPGCVGEANPHALVIYIPDPLAKFLDDLRRELIQHCNPHAHVTILPPRVLAGSLGEALQQAGAAAPLFPPFDIEAGRIETFDQTNVIYIGIERGASELRAMHNMLNTGALAAPERFSYHPHLTIAQDFDPADMDRFKALAEERWAGWRGPRTFHAETVTFVQNTVDSCWRDLAAFALGRRPDSGSRTQEPATQTTQSAP
jgi:2'-5' RNA ligase